ncbi:MULTISPECIES: NAD(P)-dependent oxidoreductase [unclassified Flavobacterium]|uniref:NAD-dependent epimerase/dehydratase family protein n=1 Tax=unclassified Flavobacterium TaxID=196869 RepID=UPI0006ABB963|nr:MULTISPECIES: NAD(P)-dependent oxidoreductase [unclassified Flavobacterium]KOP39492.1 epimerase [Flavobacterium sp. VMW]OWU91776.1 epimerase [Flavobacterium sp. NLM]
MFTKYKILVTGGSGFIGTNLTEKFIQDGHKVLNLDIKPPQKEELLNSWEKADINDLNIFRNLVLNFEPDYIVHLAARTDLDGKTLEDYNANILGVENLLKIANELSNLKKIIVTSSMLVCYGGYYPKDQFDYTPTTIYGESKVQTEKIVWDHKPSCDWAIIRPTSIWGPWFGAPYKNFFEMVIAGRYFHIGNRGCTKTYGFVGNAVYQIENILFTETRNEEEKVFFIGDDPATNIEEWGNEVADELGSKIKKVPYFVVKGAALFGDVLNFFRINFPMSSFRLHNMTTNNILNLKNTYKVAPLLPYSRKDGVKITLKWMFENKL